MRRKKKTDPYKPHYVTQEILKKIFSDMDYSYKLLNYSDMYYGGYSNGCSGKIINNVNGKTVNIDTNINWSFKKITYYTDIKDQHHCKVTELKKIIMEILE